MCMNICRVWVVIYFFTVFEGVGATMGKVVEAKLEH